MPSSASAAAVDAQARLVQSLAADASQFGPGCSQVRLLETHISYVLLTGRDAYKIKKAIKLEFLDFETLEARRLYCERELQLNRRFAPDVYLGVVAITGSPEAPHLGGEGPPIEYAVHMREFAQASLLSSLAARDALTAAHMDELAASVAALHQRANRSTSDTSIVNPAIVRALALANFAELAPLTPTDEDQRRIDLLREWTIGELERLSATLERRHRAGCTRECHGDLHLGNIAVIDGRVTPFDCIEFNDRMRWGDVFSDAAFLVMDLHHRGRPDLANRFLNAYLELTGDYDGIDTLRFYVVYRAMVRAKVAAIRAAQSLDAERTQALAEYRAFIALAERWSTRQPGAILITSGFVACGKTTLAERLVDACGAIRVRTDVERKRLHGLGALAGSGSGLNAGIYSPGETERTYSRVARLARQVAGCGYLVIADGTFLKRWQRDRLRGVAAEIPVPFGILEVVASESTLRRRIDERRARGRDASEADLVVLEEQIRTAEPLGTDEREHAVRYDADLGRLALTSGLTGRSERRLRASDAA